MTEQTAKHIIFTGRVQGVGFRFTALHVANRYGLTGFVRNLPDGSVEMLAQGPSDDIEKSIEEIKDTYPGYVREVKINQTPINPDHNDFKITF